MERGSQVIKLRVVPHLRRCGPLSLVLASYLAKEIVSATPDWNDERSALGSSKACLMNKADDSRKSNEIDLYDIEKCLMQHIFSQRYDV
jgi:hypothetical protein